MYYLFGATCLVQILLKKLFSISKLSEKQIQVMWPKENLDMYQFIPHLSLSSSGIRGLYSTAT